jgi:hypothetical protein
MTDQEVARERAPLHENRLSAKAEPRAAASTASVWLSGWRSASRF